jgi:hypothetical protein
MPAEDCSLIAWSRCKRGPLDEAESRCRWYRVVYADLYVAVYRYRPFVFRQGKRRSLPQVRAENDGAGNVLIRVGCWRLCSDAEGDQGTLCYVMLCYVVIMIIVDVL